MAELPWNMPQSTAKREFFVSMTKQEPVTVWAAPRKVIFIQTTPWMMVPENWSIGVFPALCKNCSHYSGWNEKKKGVFSLIRGKEGKHALPRPCKFVFFSRARRAGYFALSMQFCPPATLRKKGSFPERAVIRSFSHGGKRIFLSAAGLCGGKFLHAAKVRAMMLLSPDHDRSRT